MLISHHGALLGASESGGNAGFAGVMGALSAHSPFMLFGLDDEEGTVAANSGTGPDGVFSGGLVLDTPPVVDGAAASYGVTDPTGRASYPGAAVPACPGGLTIGAFLRLGPAGGQHQIVCRDDGGFGAQRFWQFRVDGPNIDFIQIRNGVTSLTRPHGTTAQDLRFCVATYAPDGTARIYVNGAQAGSAGSFAAGIDLGGPGIPVIVGNFEGYSDGKAGDRFNVGFAIGRPLSAKEVMDIWVASGA